MPAGYLAILAEKEAAHEKMIGQIKEAMATFDADGDGKLTLEELTKALCSTGTEKDPARVKSMFKECDKNKNGTVESDEFILRHKVKFLPTPCGGPPCAAFVKVRREQEKKGDSALPSAANPPSQNPVKAAWKFFAENLLWIGTGPNYGLVSVNVSPGKFQVLYESVMNFKNQEGLLKYVWFRDLTKGQWDKDGKPTEQNPVGKLCDQAAKTVGSLKLFGVARSALSSRALCQSYPPTGTRTECDADLLPPLRSAGLHSARQAAGQRPGGGLGRPAVEPAGLRLGAQARHGPCDRAGSRAGGRLHSEPGRQGGRPQRRQH